MEDVMITKPLVLIVGAGPTGMTAAIELKRAGLNVRIIDKSDHPALHSQALAVQARTLEQLQRYGIVDRAIDRGRKLTTAEFWSDGKKILSLNFEHISSRFPYVLFLPQSETEAILNDQMETLGLKIERGAGFLSMTQEGTVLTAMLGHHDGSHAE